MILERWWDLQHFETWETRRTDRSDRSWDLRGQDIRRSSSVIWLPWLPKPLKPPLLQIWYVKMKDPNFKILKFWSKSQCISKILYFLLQVTCQICFTMGIKWKYQNEIMIRHTSFRKTLQLARYSRDSVEAFWFSIVEIYVFVF